MELTQSAVSGVPKNGNGVQSSIRGLAELKRKTILSPSLNPNGNRFSSEKGADQIVVKQLIKH